ncbi:hypothetical protein LOK49_LG12G00408 [Camellia lanceoleosa]|uniref:Uncharacterized protein n=1 Tax=Camellia lanceoleosa TaxID=1840588 RepID=A0ACC0FV69_9ERIC|nr:hypothetical protein LOK49_LG12G00408 [Camellia lanceoleosa]
MKSFLLGLLCSSPNNFPTEIIQNISIEVVRDIAESAVSGLQILASNSVIKVVISSNEEVAEDEVYLEKSVSYQTPQQQREWSIVSAGVEVREFSRSVVPKEKRIFVCGLTSCVALARVHLIWGELDAFR